MSAKPSPLRRMTQEEADANWAAWVASKEPRTEHELQSRVVNYCRSAVGQKIVRDRFAAIPNGALLAGDARRRAGQVAKLKREGMRPGMPDLIFWKGDMPPEWQTTEHPRTFPEVLWLELKNGNKGTVSAEQKAVHANLIGCGFEVHIIRTFDQALEVINKFYQS